VCIVSFTDFEQRLRAGAESVESSAALWRDRVVARDAVILEAIAAGLPRSHVARWARLSRVRITQIVARGAIDAPEELPRGTPTSTPETALERYLKSA
jgi:hypothetical protein